MFRKIRNILFLPILILALSISLVGCGKEMPYPFLHEPYEIQEIQIAYIELLDNKRQAFELGRIDDCIVLADIEDISGFIEKFNNDVLFTKSWFGDPPSLMHGDYVIKITYNNGDFELIGHAAQCRVDIEGAERGGSLYAGQMGNAGYCSEDTFMNFINLYLDNPIAN